MKRSSAQFQVEGTLAPGYESVRRMLEDNFKSGSEENSQLCVYVDGEVVVDLWGSTALAATQHAFTADTVTNVFSSTKSLTAICIAMLVDRGGTNYRVVVVVEVCPKSSGMTIFTSGMLKYSDKICSHWPEFAENGKSEITIADLMRHESGLASLDQSIKPSGNTIQSLTASGGGVGGCVSGVGGGVSGGV